MNMMVKTMVLVVYGAASLFTLCFVFLDCCTGPEMISPNTFILDQFSFLKRALK